jgi:Spy/CpxP family protein refolding chaperone
VRHSLITLTGACLIVAGVAMPWASAQQGQPAVSAASMDDVLKAIRGDLQNSRAGIMAKNLTLTSAQAAQFWPVFETYQKEQNVIMDDQLKSVQWFIENFEKADDAAALRLMTAHFERDIKMTALRQHWLGEFQKTLGTKLAVRVMQIDRRLSLTHQAYIASKIPLAQ